jgi:hypothetical protein
VYFIRHDVVHNKTGHVPVNVTLEVCSRNHDCRGKAMFLTYSECVTEALFIPYAMRMHHIMLFPVACPTVPNVCTLSHKQHDFRESLFKLIRFLIFSTTFV